MLVGVDEVGRGPLAGPVVAAAVAVAPTIEGLDFGVVDSKRLKEKNRELVYEQLAANEGIRWSVCVLEPDVIDHMNILQATFHAMSQCVQELEEQPLEIGEIVVDGNIVPPQLAGQGRRCSSLVKGDQTSFAVAAASIMAKVTRDRLMEKLAQDYPQYGFEKHKGYATKAHVEALKQHGPCPEHRKSFNPVKRFLEQGCW